VISLALHPFVLYLFFMGKARWTRWDGGHGRIDAYSLELGTLVTATVRRRPGDSWAIEINRIPIGDYRSKDAALLEADGRIRNYARDFIEDWALWTVATDERFAKWRMR
jgi:hypothetical protein